MIAQIPWALSENRIPIVYFHDKCCYWTKEGYADQENVWEYYFESLLPSHPTSNLSHDLKEIIKKNLPNEYDIGTWVEKNIFISTHFWDHPQLKNKAISTGSSITFFIFF